MIVFVFGSNLQGIHGAGGALDALTHYGAKWGRGKGPMGQARLHGTDRDGNEIWIGSYAIPTCDKPGQPLSLFSIREYIFFFIEHAKANPLTEFQVTKIGCGYAGYKESQIKPLFRGAPSNCHLPIGWRDSGE